MLKTEERKSIRKVIADVKGGRDVLLKKGWTRGNYTHAGRCCAVGALQLHTTGSAVGTTDGPRGMEGYNAAIVAGRSVEATLKEQGAAKQVLVAWNDHVAKSRNAVVGLFNDTIKRLERQLKDDDNARRREQRAAKRRG